MYGRQIFLYIRIGRASCIVRRVLAAITGQIAAVILEGDIETEEVLRGLLILPLLIAPDDLLIVCPV